MMMRVLVMLLGLLVAGCGTPTKELVRFAPADHAWEGTQATEAIVYDPSRDTPGALHENLQQFRRVAQTSGVQVTNSSWITDGGLTVKARTEKLTTRVKMDFEITNGLAYRVRRVDLRLPTMGVPLHAGNAIYSPYRGGREDVWPADDWQKGMSNSSVWPGTAFSPIVTLWNKQSGDTVAVTFFNRTLTPVQLYWFSGPGVDTQHFHPFLRVIPDLGRGESVTVSVEYRIMKGGPKAHWAFYRKEFLAPFMAELGVPEAESKVKGPAAIMSPWTDPDKMKETLGRVAAKGANSFFQWSPPDGSSTYYFNPYAPSIGWFESLSAIKDVAGVDTFGVLVNPFISPYLKTDKYALPGGPPNTNLHLNPNSDDVRLYHSRLIGELTKRGVNAAFWDTGGGPDAVRGHDWFGTILTWKRNGISLMPETSCDVATWATGLWMEYPYYWGDFGLVKAICPKASYLSHTNFPDVRDGVDWRQDSLRKGVFPLVSLEDPLLNMPATQPAE